MEGLSSKDYERSCTAHHIDSLLEVLKLIKKGPTSSKRLLDIGCGFGGIALTLKSFLGFTEAYGVDIDDSAVKQASERGVVACKADVAKETLPYPDNFFDLVLCCGVLDYFITFDFGVLEAYRVLKSGGYVCVTLPNLASWHNRIAILAGYQPRDIEVSNRYLVGVHPFYLKRGEKPVGHIHTVTTKGFVQLMELYGFKMVVVKGASPMSRNDVPFYLQIIDKIVGKSPYLARRFIYLGVK